MVVLAAVVVVGVGLEMVVMVVREVREDEFSADFDDKEGNDKADVGLDVKMPDEINDGGDEDGDRNPGVVHGFGARSSEDGGVQLFAGGL